MLAAVGVLGLFTHIPAAVNIVLAVTSLALVIPEIAEFVRNRAEIQFQERNADDFADVREWCATQTRFRLFGHRTGTFLLDVVATQKMGSGELRAMLAAERYRLPEEIRVPGRRFQEQRIAGRLDVFNGPVLGIDTDLGTGPELTVTTVHFVPGSYFDHLASDLFAARDVHLTRQYRSEFGRALVIDRHGVPRDFGASWLLNAAGTSIVAITSDGWIVNVHQTKQNESAQDELAPSGSGSLEPQDFRGENEAVREVAVRGALREMTDEAGIRVDDVAETAFLGFGRWLEKGGKPELLSVARLTIDSHEARRRRGARADRPYSKFSEPCRLIQPIAEWDSSQPNRMVERTHANALSLPLLACLHLMADAVHTPGAAAHDLLHRAMDRHQSG